MDNQNLYEQSGHWGKLKSDVLFLKKVKLIKALIPRDVKTILDAGCGDGALTNLLIEDKYDIVGLDRSEEALSYLETHKMKGNIDRIPFADNSFDLVICSQVLEHLPRKVYKEAVAELMRVSRKYLIVGVPYRENLNQNTTKCFNCGIRYHLWGHLRSYRSIKQIEHLFSQFRPVDHIFTNRFLWNNRFILWIKRNIGNEWPWEDVAICPKCGLKNFDREKYENKIIRYITDKIMWRLKGREDYWWAVTLLARKG